MTALEMTSACRVLLACLVASLWALIAAGATHGQSAGGRSFKFDFGPGAVSPGYNSWGQMLTRFLKPEVAVANHAESGESVGGALAALRFDKIWSEMKEGSTPVRPRAA